MEFPDEIYENDEPFDDVILRNKMEIVRDKLISILTGNEKVEELINVKSFNKK